MNKKKNAKKPDTIKKERERERENCTIPLRNLHMIRICRVESAFWCLEVTSRETDF